MMKIFSDIMKKNIDFREYLLVSALQAIELIKVLKMIEEVIRNVTQTVEILENDMKINQRNSHFSSNSIDFSYS